jgi:hypothetical protein
MMAKRPDLAARNTKHGLSRAQPREYRSWKDMRSRVLCESNDDYADYGGRGITICDRWSDFALFFADMGERPSGMTIDRANVNGNYEPGNCRWATGKVQANNKRSNRKITWNGVTKNLQEWCDQLQIERTKVSYRLSIGMPLEEAFSQKDFRL